MATQHKSYRDNSGWIFWVVLAIILAFIGSRQAPAQELVPLNDITLTWQKVVIKDGEVIQVGNQRLKYPIILPKAVSPLGGVALVRGIRGSKQDTKTVLELFFPIKDKSAIRQWQTNSANHFPMPIKNYQILNNPDLHTFKDGWIYRITVRGKDTDIRLVVSVYTFCPAKLPPSELPELVGPAWVSAASPVKNQPSFIGIRVAYIPR